MVKSQSEHVTAQLTSSAAWKSGMICRMMCYLTPPISSIASSRRWKWSQSIWHASRSAHSTWPSSNLDCCRLILKISSLFLRWVCLRFASYSIISHTECAYSGEAKKIYPKLFSLECQPRATLLCVLRREKGELFLVCWLVGWRQLKALETKKNSFECSRWVEAEKRRVSELWHRQFFDIWKWYFRVWCLTIETHSPFFPFSLHTSASVRSRIALHRLRNHRNSHTWLMHMQGNRIRTNWQD